MKFYLSTLLLLLQVSSPALAGGILGAVSDIARDTTDLATGATDVALSPLAPADETDPLDYSSEPTIYEDVEEELSPENEILEGEELEEGRDYQRPFIDVNVE